MQTCSISILPVTLPASENTWLQHESVTCGKKTQKNTDFHIALQSTLQRCITRAEDTCTSHTLNSLLVKIGNGGGDERKSQLLHSYNFLTYFRILQSKASFIIEAKFNTIFLYNVYQYYTINMLNYIHFSGVIP